MAAVTTNENEKDEFCGKYSRTAEDPFKDLEGIFKKILKSKVKTT